MKSPSVMLFAAGFGTRMGSLTADRPKPMIRVAGRPLIDYALDLAAQISPTRVVANLHYKPQILADHLAAKGVITRHEWPDILDTGGGLRAALPLLGPDPVITLNSDAVWLGPNPLELLCKSWDPDKMDALLVCVTPENAVGHLRKGDFLMEADGQIRRGPGVTYAGAQIIKTEQLVNVPDQKFSLNILWDSMIANNRAFAVEFPGKWCDVGHPEGIALAEDLLSADV